MDYGQWLNKVEDLQLALEGQYRMRIDWGHYGTFTYRWRKAFDAGKTPSEALTECVTERMESESERELFSANLTAVTDKGDNHE